MNNSPSFLCYLNGKYTPLDKCGINPLDLGFIRGYALIEILRTYNQKIFAFSDHYQRLKNGADFLKLKIPVSKTKLQKIIEFLIKQNKLKEAKIKIILSGGVGEEDLEISPNPTLFVCAIPIHLFPPVLYETGGKLITVQYKRQNPQIKLANYIEAVRLHQLLTQKQAIELLYTLNNRVYECSTSNIFMFQKNVLMTPKNEVLAGVTRKIVLQLAKNNFKTILKNITLQELKKADEIFITSTTREILPIVKIDNQIIADGRPGEKTKFLMGKWKEFVKKKYFG